MAELDVSTLLLKLSDLLRWSFDEIHLYLTRCLAMCPQCITKDHQCGSNTTVNLVKAVFRVIHTYRDQCLFINMIDQAVFECGLCSCSAITTPSYSLRLTLQHRAPEMDCQLEQTARGKSY